MKCEDFFDFWTTLNKYYRHLKAGETNHTHIFTIDSSVGATVVDKKDDFNAEEREDNILPTARNRTVAWRRPEERKPMIAKLLDELENSEPPRIVPIKQVDLFTK